jgi:hypothetical protein
MMRPGQRRGIAVAAAVLAVCGILAALRGIPSKTPPQTLPMKLTDAEFWRMTSEFSEPDGFFRSDNFVSNETTFQHVIPELSRNVRPDGVYIGVGPDQNFTYIAALKPRLAFIVDIRRQNMIEHLMYKAIMEISSNRIEFLSILFSRPLPPELPAESSTEQLFAGLDKGESSSELFHANFERIVRQLTEFHGFALSAADLHNLEYVFGAFRTAGPEIRYSYPSQWGWRRFPSYADLMQESDVDGRQHSYLASEATFQWLKQLEASNRIVPIVGNLRVIKRLRRWPGTSRNTMLL